MLAIFESEAISRVNIRHGRANTQVERRGMDAQAWAFLAEGIRSSAAGPPVPDHRGIIFRIAESANRGGSGISQIVLDRGVLFSRDPWLGGALRTLEVGPEFAEGMRLLSERVGVREPELMIRLRDAGRRDDGSRQPGSSAASAGATRAAAIAKRFARQHDLPLGADPAVEVNGVDSSTGAALAWTIVNGSLAWVVVDALDERITVAHNGVAHLRIKGWPKAAALSREEAVARGGRVLEAMGLDSASMSLTDAQLSADEAGWGGVWYLRWVRTRYGIPIEAEEARVSLDAADGQLVTAHAYVGDLPCEPADVLVDGDRAAGVALALARELFVTEQARVEGAPKLRYVRQNYDAETRSHIGPSDGPLRAAWEVTIRPPVEVRMGARATMWIDAQSCELLGGHHVPDAVEVERRTAILEGRNARRRDRQQSGPPHLAVIAGAGGVIMIVLAILYWPRPARLTLADAGDSGQASESGAGEDGANT
jgi:hypothetical protein